MAQLDLLITEGKVVTSSGIKKVNILVEEGKINAITGKKSFYRNVSAKKVIDAKGLFVLPGIVDAHVHIDEPGREDREDISSGTQAAAAGGVTTVVVMPNVLPPVNSAKRVINRRDLFDKKAYVDFSLLGGAGVELPENIKPQADAGVVGYKSYLRTFNPDRKGLICQNAGDLYIMMNEVKRTGLSVGIHAEDETIINVLVRELRSQGKTRFEHFLQGRPESSEILAVLTLCEMAYFTKAKINLVHTSSPRAVNLANRWQGKGAAIQIETCPHYLVFSNEDTCRLGPYAQVVPPLRSPECVDKMWGLLEKNHIDFISSDHAPNTREEKQKGKSDIFSSGGGLPGLETLLPILLDQVNKGQLSLEKLTKLISTNPAKRMGIYPKKGCIFPGSDADIVLVDMKQTKTFHSNNMYTKGKEAAKLYDAMKVKGYPIMTILRGSIIMKEGEVIGTPGTGEMVTPILRKKDF